VPLAVCGYAEPSLVFYARRSMTTLNGRDEVAEWARRPEPGVLVIPRDVLARVESRCGPLGLTAIGSARGVNYSNGKLMELAVLERPAAKPAAPAPPP
jgi:hypothetical protein